MAKKVKTAEHQVKDNATADRKKRENMVKEVIDLIIKRSGVPRREIYDRAVRTFCLNNMDLLTSEELKKYEPVIL